MSASDAGEPALTATTTIYVNVKDVNDNPPDIEKSLYEINVAENVAIGTTILHVRVTDKDSGTVCHGLRLTKQDDYFRATFDHF